MDIYGESFVRTRDEILKYFEGAEEFSEVHAEMLGNRIASSFARLLEERGLNPSYTRRNRGSLDRSVGIKIEESLKPGLASFKKEAEERDFPLSLDAAEGCFDDCLHASYDVYLSLIERTSQIENWILLRSLLGSNSALLNSPPVAIQHESSQPVKFLYYMIPYTVLLESALVVPDWAEKAQALSKSSYEALIRKRRNNETLNEIEEYIMNFRFINDETTNLVSLADEQWSIAGLLGSIMGTDTVEMAWYKHAIDFLDQSFQRYRQFRNRSHGAFDAFQVIEDPSQALNVAGMALRHITMGEPFSFPSSGRVNVSYGEEKVTSIRIVINHGLVAYKEAEELLKQGMHDLRRSKRRRGISEGELQFLDAVSASGLEPGLRAKHGFWPSFVKNWNENNPKNKIRVNNARVKYHRLMKRLKNR